MHIILEINDLTCICAGVGVVAPIQADFMQIAGFLKVCLRASFSLVFSLREGAR